MPPPPLIPLVFDLCRALDRDGVHVMGPGLRFTPQHPLPPPKAPPPPRPLSNWAKIYPVAPGRIKKNFLCRLRAPISLGQNMSWVPSAFDASKTSAPPPPPTPPRRVGVGGGRPPLICPPTPPHSSSSSTASVEHPPGAHTVPTEIRPSRGEVPPSDPPLAPGPLHRPVAPPPPRRAAPPPFQSPGGDQGTRCGGHGCHSGVVWGHEPQVTAHQSPPAPQSPMNRRAVPYDVLNGRSGGGGGSAVEGRWRALGGTASGGGSHRMVLRCSRPPDDPISGATGGRGWQCPSQWVSGQVSFLPSLSASAPSTAMMTLRLRSISKCNGWSESHNRHPMGVLFMGTRGTGLPISVSAIALWQPLLPRPSRHGLRLSWHAAQLDGPAAPHPMSVHAAHPPRTRGAPPRTCGAPPMHTRRTPTHMRRTPHAHAAHPPPHAHAAHPPTATWPCGLPSRVILWIPRSCVRCADGWVILNLYIACSRSDFLSGTAPAEASPVGLPAMRPRATGDSGGEGRGGAMSRLREAGNAEEVRGVCE